MTLTKSFVGLGVLGLLTLIVAAAFTQPTPPGGVSWHYYVVALFIPYAAFLYAYRLTIAICYGFACGLLLAWPVFVDGRTPLRAEYGLESQAELVTKILLFAIGLSALCATSYGLSWRCGKPVINTKQPAHRVRP